jgi:replicative DNA helicase
MTKVIDTQSQDIRRAVPATVGLESSIALLERNHRAKEAGGTVGVPTGIKCIDEALGGLQEGLHVIAGEPGAGKTALALNIVRHCSREGYPVLYASCDEMFDRLIIKLICAQMGLRASELLKGNGDLGQFIQASDNYGSDLLSNIFFISPDMRFSLLDIGEQLQRQLEDSAKDKGLLVIDYLQPFARSMMMLKSDKQRYRNMEFRHVIGAVCENLRGIANKLKIPVIIICSQNREGQNTNKMSSLKESGEIEYSIDAFMALCKANENDTRSTGIKLYRSLTFVKNRFGTCDTYGLTLNGLTQAMTDFRSASY